MSFRGYGPGQFLRVILPLMCAAALACGCATNLDRARADFYAGRLDTAEALLRESKVPDTDKVLLQMERGMILQNLGRYAESSHDFINAADELERLRVYSVSKGAASMLVNDNVQDFMGFPFEQSLLHSFTAKNHFALGKFDSAAVESRRLIKLFKKEKLGKYPEDAYSHYIAGLGLEMIDDWSNAQLQYGKAAKASTMASVGKAGAVGPKGSTPKEVKSGHQLICLVAAGRVPRRGMYKHNYILHSQPIYAEIYVDGLKAGRSYVLTDTAGLAFSSEQILAAKAAAKTIARVAIKDAIADSVEEKNELLGALVHILLIELLEQPDLRRWETLPRWLGVARVNVPHTPGSVEAVFRTSGYEIKRVNVTAPIVTRRDKSVTFVRDIVPVPRNVVTGKTGEAGQ